jgi:hypothetical protein
MIPNYAREYSREEAVKIHEEVNVLMHGDFSRSYFYRIYTGESVGVFPENDNSVSVVIQVGIHYESLSNHKDPILMNSYLSFI